MKRTLPTIWLLLASIAPAQTYVVAAGGGGQFTDLPAAVAAVPSGSTLHVKAGSYSAFTVRGMTLTILAETPGSATIQVASAQPVVVTGIGASDYVHVSGFVVKGVTGTTSPTVSITGCTGNVLLHQLSTTDAAIVAVDHCSSVHVLSCSMPSVSSVTASPRLVVTASNVEVADSTLLGCSPALAASGSGLLATLGSVVTLCGSVVAGGDASSSFLNIRGGDGVVANGSTIHVLGRGPSPGTLPTSIKGGAGGPQTSMAGTGGDGGDGLVLASGAKARVFGAVLAGGPPGGTFHVGVRGMALRVDFSSVAAQYPGYGPSAFLAGTVGAGLLVKPSLWSPPGSAAVLYLGTVNTFFQSWPISLGAWTVDAPPLVLGGLSVPASGLLEVPITVPIGWPGDTVVVGQFLMFDTVLNELQASNTFTVITR